MPVAFSCSTVCLALARAPALRRSRFSTSEVSCLILLSFFSSCAIKPATACLYWWMRSILSSTMASYFALMTCGLVSSTRRAESICPVSRYPTALIHLPIALNIFFKVVVLIPFWSRDELLQAIVAYATLLYERPQEIRPGCFAFASIVRYWIPPGGCSARRPWSG